MILRGILGYPDHSSFQRMYIKETESCNANVFNINNCIAFNKY